MGGDFDFFQCFKGCLNMIAKIKNNYENIC